MLQNKERLVRWETKKMYKNYAEMSLFNCALSRRDFILRTRIDSPMNKVKPVKMSSRNMWKPHEMCYIRQKIVTRNERNLDICANACIYLAMGH